MSNSELLSVIKWSTPALAWYRFH